MKVHRLVQILSALVLQAALVALTPVTASAGGYELTLEEFDSFAGYTVSIADSYQFPAALVNQPGVQLPLAPPRPLYIRVGDHHVIIR